MQQMNNFDSLQVLAKKIFSPRCHKNKLIFRRFQYFRNRRAQHVKDDYIFFFYYRVPRRDELQKT